MQLVKKLIIFGQLEAITGIAIGGTNAAMNIGGVDKGIIRNPVTNEPYIPGSSLKGKMRSLLELRDGTIAEVNMGAVKYGPSMDQKHRATRLFGNAVGSQREKQRPSRVVVRDAYLSEEQWLGEKSMSKHEFFNNTDLPFSEVKTEVVIDRITSRAMPRQLERVPAGARFNFEMILNIFNDDNEAELVQDLFSALKLLENDYIGGAGSRGSGQIRFIHDAFKITERSAAYYRGEEEELDLTNNYKNRLSV